MPPDGMPKRWSAVILLACLAFSTLVPRVQAQQTEEASTEEETSRRQVRIDVGGGWGIPIDDVALEGETVQDLQPLDVNLNSGPHLYAGLGFVRSIAENFALGARLRGQATRLRSTVDACGGEIRCQNPNGLLWAATLEGRIIITAPDWINPYLLVGLGAVQATVDPVTLRNVPNPNLPDEITFSGSSVTDAGGDIGLGASLPITDYLYFDAEFRVTGALPGGKENDVTVLPFSAGISVGF